MLVDGPDFNTCRVRIERYFNRTLLVKYDSILIAAEKSINGSDPKFWELITAGITQNRCLLAELLHELKESGLDNINALTTLPQGYPSKTLHTMAHLLDGFFGVDSHFYNLMDDSHWLNDSRHDHIKQTPESYWLIHVEASSETGEADQISTLRSNLTDES